MLKLAIKKSDSAFFCLSSNFLIVTSRQKCVKVNVHSVFGRYRYHWT